MSTSTISRPQSTRSVAIAGVCLDVHTYMALSQFMAQQPGGGGLGGNFTQYFGAEREAARTLEAGGTRVCIVDLDSNAAEGNLTIQRLQAEYPEIYVFAVSGSPDTEQIVSAMRNGCTDFLTKPLHFEALENALRRVEMKQRERSHKKNRGKVISVIGAKGGTGVTTLALHLSLSLARESGKKCLLVDLHSGLGDTSLYLGAPHHRYSFYELAASSERLDEELLHGFVLHHDSGLDVLDSPESVDFSAYAPPAAVEQTISFLSEAYQYVVIDCAPGLSDANVSALTQSDQIAIVLTAELPAVRNAVRYTDYLSKVGVNSKNYHLVLNRYSKKAPLGEDKIEKTLQYPIGLRVPNDYHDIIRAINAGTPIETSRKSEFGASITSWCKELISEPVNQDLSVRKHAGKSL